MGTPIYASPEIHNNELYDFKTDVWSLGVIMYAMLSGTYPFIGKSKDDFISNIIEGNYNFTSNIWESISE